LNPALFAGAFALFLLAACAPARTARRPEAPPPETATAAATRPVLRVIHLIHGDGEYSYHDSSGKRLHADREALERAREAGRSRPDVEVYVFHLRAGRTGWFTGRHDGTWEHYRGGALLEGGRYTRAEKDTAFEAEAAILLRHRGAAALPVTRLAYFGHELPLRDAEGYFRANPQRPFSQARLARALAALQPPDFGKPFEGVVLSMCYGGNPGLIEALRPVANWAVASPAYLHLSYLDADALADPGARFPADTVAARSFARLGAHVSTEITTAVYDLDRVRPPAVPVPANAADPLWKDCAEAPGFDSASAAAGTRLFYRPPRFGAGRDKAARSAWQCAF
jgi:hypothetical protein